MADENPIKAGIAALFGKKKDDDEKKKKNAVDQIKDAAKKKNDALEDIYSWK